jgi:hypothetical protein
MKCVFFARILTVRLTLNQPNLSVRPQQACL